MLTSAHASHLLAPQKQDSKSQIVPVLHFYSSPQPFPLEYAGPVVDRMMCGVSVSLMNRENKEGCGCYTMPNITVGTMGREAEASMETQCVCSMVICNPSCYEGEGRVDWGSGVPAVQIAHHVSAGKPSCSEEATS